MNNIPDLRSQLPSVDRVLNHLKPDAGLDCFSHVEKADAIRDVLNKIRSGQVDEIVPTLEAVGEKVRQTLLAQQLRGLHPVINATGIILHTGLGRAVLPAVAMEAIGRLNGYCNLQINLENGERGRREAVVEQLLQTLTGAEAATVVNNNAAATLLVLSALCAGGEVIVSRGQLIEIGGSFRLPDVIAQSGARMVEVGTTNKTHLRDYRNAITENTRVLLRVNPSNYRIIGFSQSVSTAELVELKKEHDVIVVDDLGCGALVDLSHYGLPHEPMVQESIRAGADVALFSGDKLISGPQCGILIGRKNYLDGIRKHPLMRALRVDKFTIAALEATLRLFLTPETLPQTHPLIHMITLSYEELHRRAETLRDQLAPYLDCEVIEGESACGGGSLPNAILKSAIVTLAHWNFSASDLAKRLRTGRPTVIARIQEGRVCLDVRTLQNGEESLIVEAIRGIVSHHPKQI